MSRIWNDDFEKRLQHMRQEEADVLARMSRRSRAWMRITMQIIGFSLVLEVIAIAYAITIATAPSPDLSWEMRVFGVFPMLLFPALSSSVLYGFVTISRTLDQRDEITLERLHAEIHAKFDECMEEINHYKTQKLIQIRMEQMLLDLLSFRTVREPAEEIDLYEDFDTEAEIGLYEDFDTEVERQLGLLKRNRKQRRQLPF